MLCFLLPITRVCQFEAALCATKCFSDDEPVGANRSQVSQCTLFQGKLCTYKFEITLDTIMVPMFETLPEP